MQRNLKIIRKAAGLSQHDLAVKSGIRIGTISAIETGRMKNPSYRTVDALARALDVQPSSVMTVTPAQEENSNTAA